MNLEDLVKSIVRHQGSFIRFNLIKPRSASNNEIISKGENLFCGNKIDTNIVFITSGLLWSIVPSPIIMFTAMMINFSHTSRIYTKAIVVRHVWDKQEELFVASPNRLALLGFMNNSISHIFTWCKAADCAPRPRIMKRSGNRSFTCLNFKINFMCSLLLSEFESYLRRDPD